MPSSLLMPIMKNFAFKNKKKYLQEYWIIAKT